MAHPTHIVSRKEVSKQIGQIEAHLSLNLKEAILKHRRIDLLAKEVMDLDVAWHHQLMLQHQFEHSPGLVLGFRGSGKTTMRTVVRGVYQFCQDRNRRTLIGSQKESNAIDSLVAIRTHLERNEKLIHLFGEFVGPKWNDKEFIVSGRTRIFREASMMVTSPRSALASKHVNDFFWDDIADETSSLTKGLRDQTDTWVHKVALPILIPDDYNIWATGTRYHPDDIYGRLGAPPSIQADPEESVQGALFSGDRTLIIPSEYKDDDGNRICTWPEKFSLEFLDNVRGSSDIGAIAYTTQYEQDVSLMNGANLISYDQIDKFDTNQMPDDLPNIMGVDLAIGQKKKSDETWIVVGAYDRNTKDIWVHTSIHGRFPFSKQRQLIEQVYKEFDCVEAGVESTAYQQAQVQELKRLNGDMNIRSIDLKIDKYSKMQRVTPRFEQGKVHIAAQHMDLIKQLVNFTGERGKADDGADAIHNLLYLTMGKKKRPPRDKEPGLP